MVACSQSECTMQMAQKKCWSAARCLSLYRPARCALRWPLRKLHPQSVCWIRQAGHCSQTLLLPSILLSAVSPQGFSDSQAGLIVVHNQETLSQNPILAVDLSVSKRSPSKMLFQITYVVLCCCVGSYKPLCACWVCIHTALLADPVHLPRRAEPYQWVMDKHEQFPMLQRQQQWEISRDKRQTHQYQSYRGSHSCLDSHAT